MRRFDNTNGVSPAHFPSGLVEAIREVGRQRAALLAAMKAALEGGDNEQALSLGKQLCGIANEVK